MKNRKAVFFDIDGTIYLYGKGVPQDTADAIKELRSNGHLAILCTGRTKSMIFPEIYKIGFDGIIAGAGTYVEIGGNILHKFIMDNEEAAGIIKDMKLYGIMAIPEGINAIYFDRERMPEDYIPIYNLYVDKVGENARVLTDTDNLEVSKISGEVLENGNREEFINEYRDGYNIVSHGGNFIEMIPKNYSKAVGIERLIRYLGISRENTYAFGDGMNDYEMLNYVRYGVAMGNAAEEFRNMMRYVTDDYDKGGISIALRKFGLIN